jgi:hypothetical protein
MLTPDEVLRELKERGYDVSSRRLVDWRQKQLVPPVKKRGRGQGRGWVYVWEDPQIVEQVIAVQELLWIHERTSWLYVPLWCLGFNVPLERVRSQLLARIERRQSFLTGGEKDPEELGFQLSELALTEVTRPGPRRGRSQESADVLEYWLNVLAGDTDYAPDWEALEEIATALWRFSGRDALAGMSVDSWRLDELDLDVVQRWARQYAAMPRLEEVVLNAAESEWTAVHADWQALAQAVRTFGTFAEEEDRWDHLHFFWFRAIAVAGPWLNLVDLSMRRQGQGKMWDDIRHGVSVFIERLEAEPDLQQQVRELWSEAGPDDP